MARYLPCKRTEWVKPLKSYSVDAPRLNPQIAEFMFSSTYRERSRMTQAYLVPQEVVLHRGGVVRPPTVARAWVLRPNQARLLGIDVPDKVERESEWGNYSCSPEYFLVEHWEDCGDDGHTSYELVGYALLDEEQFNSMVDPDLTLIKYIDRP